MDIGTTRKVYAVGAIQILTSLCGKSNIFVKIFIAFCNCRLEKSFDVLSFVFKVKMKILGKFLTEKNREVIGPGPLFLRLCFSG